MAEFIHPDEFIHPEFFLLRLWENFQKTISRDGCFVSFDPRGKHAHEIEVKKAVPLPY